MKYTIETIKESNTREVAKKIGLKMQAGDVILLEGDLGAGKTTFTKGLAEGLDIPQMVKSPTFTIVREYTKGRIPLYHMDVYRLENAEDDLGLDEYFQGDGVSVVEWAHFIEQDLPAEYIRITLKHLTENTRAMEIEPVGTRYEALCSEVFGE
ncbi:tRNA (adenosine(37)-N6)-threonylcarbamoyltransferase complex ATPase subunit type 1 TsaE [Listeria sp. FSL L7-1582]|uniref:tRNA (adenosine(37)-N6)-threonylcarbamoyltransferase complex ATPase subunit type 1 TsaE n=1 Tax=Listeria portnoyi TaxID=2713504 RepID=UPI00164E57FC|nr:tRNA (adenosine(37)-N6)-threonylcarbamoyltransferase complex ATPase subunit type 1 TsaE [Listeria portnoyi]MBC6308937.1 tRNA (adenosine(37)-N6)-threonylcarbamoyltransferase complex ATPase subunit type 1 TsaE [Listeria portnoyi]